MMVIKQPFLIETWIDKNGNYHAHLKKCKPFKYIDYPAIMTADGDTKDHIFKILGEEKFLVKRFFSNKNGNPTLFTDIIMTTSEMKSYYCGRVASGLRITNSVSLERMKEWGIL